jgi:S-adenosylmethionine:tRNA ribosyltransferase-isomerase
LSGGGTAAPARPAGPGGDELAGYDFALPPDRIAQEPVEPRDAARLLVLDRITGGCRDATVAELPGLLEPGDCVVVNDTRVVPARLLGRLAGTGRPAEVLLLPPADPAAAGPERDALLRPARRCPPGAVVLLDGGAARVVVVGREEAGRARVRLEGGPVAALLEAHGRVPLPPYIRRHRDPGPRDRTRYQTVYAARDGAVAAPTAGLHLTAGLLDRLRARGVAVAAVTLHVGPGTFRPVRAARLAAHRVEAEWCEVPPEVAARVAAARTAGRRVVAVGTTTVRALESAARPDGAVAARRGPTDLTIVPGHRFRAVDALLTNFHLPRSSLLLLVAAFAGREALLAAYARAVAGGYRFYSYGDAMLVR